MATESETVDQVASQAVQAQRKSWLRSASSRNYLYQQAFERSPSAGENLSALALTVAAVAIALGCPAGHHWDPLMAGLAAGLIVLGVIVALYTRGPSPLAITQPAFVVLLFAVPLNLLPILVIVLFMIGQQIRCRRLMWSALPRLLNNGWWCLPPAAIVAALASGPPEWRHWPVYCLALLGEFLFDAGSNSLNPVRRVLNTLSFKDNVADFLNGFMIDLVLSPIGLGIALLARTDRAAAITSLICVYALMMMLARERSYSSLHQELALRDPLTGVANRIKFAELSEAARDRCTRTNVSAGIMLTDLDGFKAINDRHGHQTGDEVLRQFASFLLDHLRPIDTVARIGGDEFALLIAEPVTIEDLTQVADQIRRTFDGSVQIEGVEPGTLRASVGAALLDGEHTASEALAAADQSMYVEKRARRRAR